MATNSCISVIIKKHRVFLTSNRVLRYLDRPLTMSGKPSMRSKDKVTTRVKNFNDGIRVRHWVDHNSVKVYNEQNVLRIETTINKLISRLEQKYPRK